MKETPAADSQMNCSSSLLLLSTRTLSEQVGRKEANPELHKKSPPGARLGDRPEIVHELVLLETNTRNLERNGRPEVVHELVLRHTKTRILDRDGRIGFVEDETARLANPPPFYHPGTRFGAPGRHPR